MRNHRFNIQGRDRTLDILPLPARVYVVIQSKELHSDKYFQLARISVPCFCKDVSGHVRDFNAPGGASSFSHDTDSRNDTPYYARERGRTCLHWKQVLYDVVHDI